MNKFYLYIDESGDHGLAKINLDFPIFLLCGVLVSNENYININNQIVELKNKFWGQKDVILHSRDIRKCNKEFQILFDLELKKQFYCQLNNFLQNSNYQILASAIDKNLFIEHYGKLSDDVYEIALSSIIERAVLCIDEIDKPDIQLTIVIEKRGKKEDKKLDEHFQRLLSRGTSLISAERIKQLNTTIEFKDKKENINGLQLADLIAYPLARYVLEPKRANPSYEIIESKIYMKQGVKVGLIKYP